MNWLILTIFLTIVSSMKMGIVVKAGDTVCVYQRMMQHQKYAIEITPKSRGYFELAIRHQKDNQWEHSVFRSNEDHFQQIKLHKVAKHEALYSFCISNYEAQKVELSVNIRFGLELLDLKIIPNETDHQMIERQAEWVQKQADKIHKVVQQSAFKRRQKDEYANLMRKKLIGYGILGLFVLFGITLGFFVQLKKILKQRKIL